MLYKNTLKKIKKSLGRYISLLVIVMVGVGFYAGIESSAPNIVKVADRYYNSSRLMLFKIVSTLGLTDDDVEAIRQIDEVRDAIPSYSMDAVSDINVVRLHAIEDGVNTVKLTEGHMPETETECVADSLRNSIGDVIELTDNEDGHIKTDRFTVVGLVDSALYFGGYGSTPVGSGRLHSFAFVDRGMFDLEAYTEIYVVAEASNVLAYSEEYKALVARLNDKFVSIKPAREDARYDEVIGTALELLAEAEEELADEKAKAELELSDAWRELEDGEQELLDGKITGQQELDDAIKELEEGEQELLDGKITGQEELDDAKKQLDDGTRELLDNKALARKEFDDGRNELEDGRREFEDGKRSGKKELDDAKKALDDGQRELLEGKELGEREFADARRRLDDGMLEIQNGLMELDEGEAALEESIRIHMAEFEEARQQIDEGWAQIDEALASFGITREQAAPLAETMESAFAYLESLLETMTPDSPGYAFLTMVMAESAGMLDGLRELVAAIDLLTEQEQMLEDGIALFNEEIAKARLEIENGRARLAEGLREINAGYEAYFMNLAAFLQRMEDGQRELDEGFRKYWEGLKEYEDKIAEGRKELLKGYYEYLYNLGKASHEFAKGERELSDGYGEYRDGLATFQAEIEDGERKLAEGYEEYYDGLATYLAEIEDGERKLADGFAEYYDGLAEFEAEIADAEVKIMDAKEEIADISHPRWYIFNRDAVSGYSDLGSAVDTVSSLSAALPILFILIALFITSNSMTRMIAEERGELGTLVSLGYDNGRIISTYLLYVLSATGLGAVLGYFIGCRFIPGLVYSNFPWKLPPLETEYNLWALLWIVLFTFALMSGVTIVTCRRELKQKPAALMRPLPPKSGQKILLERIGVLWRRFSFTWKITIRNIFRYKKRAAMTILGMAGCAALLVVAFGLRDGMSGIAQQQYGEIFRFGAMVTLKDETLEIDGELQELLEREQLAKPLLLRQSAFSCEKDGKTMDFNLIVPQNEAMFREYYHLTSRLDKHKISLDGSSAVVTQRLAKVLNVKKGDTITIKNTDNEPFQVTVTDVAENYAHNYLYINGAAYGRIFGEEVSFNTVVANHGGADETGLAERLTDSGLAVNVTMAGDIVEQIAESTQSLNGVTVLVAVVASLLAVVVLYNLTSINISERTREIATLKVLGFRDGEANTYIYREAVVLSLASVGVGLVLGAVLHNLMLDVIEAGAITLLKRISFFSFALSGALSMLFSLLMQIATYRKLKKIDMIGALKSVE